LEIWHTDEIFDAAVTCDLGDISFNGNWVDETKNVMTQIKA